MTLMNSASRTAGRMIQKDELEKIGRRFINEALRDFVKLVRMKRSSSLVQNTRG